MITIWKYPLQVKGFQYVEIPRGAKYLNVDSQNGIPCLWAQVDTDAPVDSIGIVTRGTGHPIKSENMKYVGTYQLDGGSFVGHVFVA